MKKILLALSVMMMVQSAHAAPAKVTRDGYVFGGLVGSIAGFGIGHAVQGRYTDMGWIFTAGEGVGILTWLTLPWIIQLANNGVNTVASEVTSKVGMAIFGGFRLWQVADLWVNARPERHVFADIKERHWQKGWRGAEKSTETPVASLNILSW